jgi:hypothetical protein
VSADARNTKVVAVLIAVLTIGAQLLLLLEPAAPGWSRASLLMAERATPIQDVVIEYAPADRRLDPRQFDCLIAPDGRCDWRPRGPHVRLVVIGSAGEQLPEPQARKLLSVLGSLHETRGLDLRRVRLDAGSDPRKHASLPAQAQRLFALLAGRDIVR